MGGWACAGRHYQTGHASLRARPTGFMHRCRNAGTSLDPLAGQSETGAREPSEDTAKRATFARM